jgi:hypothetical protein
LILERRRSAPRRPRQRLDPCGDLILAPRDPAEQHDRLRESSLADQLPEPAPRPAQAEPLGEIVVTEKPHRSTQVFVTAALLENRGEPGPPLRAETRRRRTWEKLSPSKPDFPDQGAELIVTRRCAKPGNWQDPN